MSTPDATGKLLLGLAAAVGAALVLFARKFGVEPEGLGEGPPPAPPVDDPAVNRARAELYTWSGRKETDPSTAGLLSKYWAAVGLPLQPSGTPWSAAFISYVGAGALQASANHVGYARAALKERRARKAGRYWAYQPSELARLRVGDILVRGRGQPVSWQDIETDTGHKDSHGDLVTGVGDAVVVIGGNVSNSVTQRFYDSEEAAREGVFAVLRKGEPDAAPGVA